MVALHRTAVAASVQLRSVSPHRNVSHVRDTLDPVTHQVDFSALEKPPTELAPHNIGPVTSVMVALGLFYRMVGREFTPWLLRCAFYPLVILWRVGRQHALRRPTITDEEMSSVFLRLLAWLGGFVGLLLL